METENGITTAQLMDGALLGKFLVSLNVARRSAVDYKYSLKAFFGFLACRGIERPSYEHVFAYRDALIDMGKKPSTIRSYIAAVKIFFRWTARERLCGNIAESVKIRSQVRGHRRDALTAQQAMTMLEHVDRGTLAGLRNYAMLTLMLTGGLRCVEVARASVGDLMEMGNGKVLYVHGKVRDEGGVEYVKLSSRTAEALMDYLNKRGAVDDNAALFASVGNRNRGGHLSTRMISKIAKDALLNAGLNSRRLCAHSLRHTAITLALKGGERLEAVKEFARHTSINTTLSTATPSTSSAAHAAAR